MQTKLKTSFKSSDITFTAVNLALYRIFTRLPMTVFKASGSAAPLFSFLSGIAAIGFIWLISSFLFKNINGNLLDAAKSCFGKTGKLLFTLLIIFYLAVSLIFTIKSFSSLIGLIAFPSSPLWFVAAFLVLGAILAALGSTSSILRIHGVFVPIIAIVFILLTVSTIFTGDTLRISSPASTEVSSAVNALSGIIFYADILILLLLAPTKENRRHISKAISIGAIFAFLLNFLFTLSFTLNIPQSIAQNQQFPIYLLMKEVYFGRFFQRLDAFILLISALSAMLYMSLNLNMIGSVLKQGLETSSGPPLIILIGILSALAALANNIFPSDTILSSLYVCSFGLIAYSGLTAIWIKVRCFLSEKK